jgi:excinuclease UvrABC ATPase subunit
MSKIKSMNTDVIATKKASEFGVSEPQFLWYPFLPAKKLVVCQGESGIGKSSFILNIAARLSRGEHMPFVESEKKLTSAIRCISLPKMIKKKR